MKTITLDHKKQLDKVLEDKNAVKKYENYIISNLRNKFFLATSFLDNRQRKIAYYCQSCGHFEIKDEHSRLTECPHCGNSSRVTISNYSPQHFSFVLPLETNDEYAVLALFHGMESIYANKDDTDLKASLENAFVSINLDKPHLYMVSFSQGVRELETNSYTNTSVFRENRIIAGYKDVVYYKDAVYDGLRERLKEDISFSDDAPLLDIINAIAEDIKDTRARKASSKVSKAKISKDELLEELKSISFDDLTEKIEIALKDITNIPSLVLSSTPAYDELLIICPNCKTAEKLMVKNKSFGNVSFTCPHCAKEYEGIRHFNMSSFTTVFNTAVFWSKYKGFLVARLFSISTSIREVSSGTFELKNDIKEDSRVFLDEKNTYFYHYRPWHKSWDFVSGGSFQSRAFSPTIRLQTDEELISLFKDSFAKYSGILDAWGLGLNKDLKIEEPGTFGRMAYLYSWQKKHYLELLLKAGFKDIVEDVLNYKKLSEDIANPRGTTVLDVLGINRPMLKIAQKSKASLAAISTIRKLWNIDNTLSYDDYQFIKNTGREELFVKIKENFNIPFSKQIEYVKSCFDFQCINNSDAIGLWSDYLGFAKDIGYNLKNKNAKYPSSLKREHDVALFVKNSMTSKKCDKKAFETRAKENSKFNYSLKTSGLEVFAPTKPEEIINEGMVLHHCVSHYVNAVIEGRSIVMFIRKDDDRETPYYTAEVISDGVSAKITQVKGNMNTDPDPSTPEGKKVLDFVSKWAKFKKLTLAF